MQVINSVLNRILAKFGIGIPWQSSVVVPPYLAGGYQDWQRNLLGTGGYDETYSAGLVGAGLLLQIAPTPRWVLGLDAELLAVVDGENSSTGLMPYPVPIAFSTSGEEKIGLQANYHLRGPSHFFAGTAFTHFNYTRAPIHPQVLKSPPRQQTSSRQTSASPTSIDCIRSRLKRKSLPHVTTSPDSPARISC